MNLLFADARADGSVWVSRLYTDLAGAGEAPTADAVSRVMRRFLEAVKRP